VHYPFNYVYFVSAQRCLEIYQHVYNQANVDYLHAILFMMITNSPFHFILTNSDLSTSDIIHLLARVPVLDGDNFNEWKNSINHVLLVTDYDHSIRTEFPVEPVTVGDNDATLAERKTAYEKIKARWERSDKVALMMMDNKINPAVRGALPKEPKNAKEFLAKIEEHYQSSSKADGSTLMMKMLNAKYTGQGSV